MSNFTLEQVTKIENILIDLESKIERIECVLFEATNINYDLNDKELKKLDLKINIAADYMPLLKNDIQKIYGLFENENAALDTLEDEKELH